MLTTMLYILFSHSGDYIKNILCLTSNNFYFLLILLFELKIIIIILVIQLRFNFCYQTRCITFIISIIFSFFQKATILNVCGS